MDGDTPWPRNNRCLRVGKMVVANGERANMIRPYIGCFGVCNMDGVVVVFEFD
jgi:hypothetical protein